LSHYNIKNIYFAIHLYENYSLILTFARLDCSALLSIRERFGIIKQKYIEMAITKIIKMSKPINPISGISRKELGEITLNAWPIITIVKMIA
jgi:hypothetical protein